MKKKERASSPGSRKVKSSANLSARQQLVTCRQHQVFTLSPPYGTDAFIKESFSALMEVQVEAPENFAFSLRRPTSPLASFPLCIRPALPQDSFCISASSYSELEPSSAVSFFSSLADKTIPGGSNLFRGLQVHDVLANRYLLIRKIYGSSSATECWHARSVDPTDTAEFAVKIVRSDRAWNEEVAIWKSLDHPNILPLLDAFEITVSAHLRYRCAISILAERGSLLRVLADPSNCDKFASLSLGRIRNIFQQVVCAVKYLHDRRIVHKDIKLENILIHQQDRVLLCDFEFSLYIPTESLIDDFLKVFLNERSHIGGTLQYCSPEQLDCASSLLDLHPDLLLERLKKADTWALGIVLYCMVRGEFPFFDEYLPRLRHSILFTAHKETGIPEVDDLLGRLLHKRHEERLDCSNILDHFWMQSLSSSSEEDFLL